MNFIKVANAMNDDPVWLNLDSISLIEKNGCYEHIYQVRCSGGDVSVNQRDYQRILSALGIR